MYSFSLTKSKYGLWEILFPYRLSERVNGIACFPFIQLDCVALYDAFFLPIWPPLSLIAWPVRVNLFAQFFHSDAAVFLQNLYDVANRSDPYSEHPFKNQAFKWKHLDSEKPLYLSCIRETTKQRGIHSWKYNKSSEMPRRLPTMQEPSFWSIHF